MDLRIFDTAEAMSRAAAAAAAERMSATPEDRFFALVLSGGRTPRRFHELLATEYRERIPWSRLHVFWGDERCVPPDDPASNYRMARETLLHYVPIPPDQIHRIPTELPPDVAAAAYAETLRRVFEGAPPTFDLTLLGLGEDGHTASLFPGAPDGPSGADVIATSAPPGTAVRERVSLTFDALNRSRSAFFLVAGENKRPVLDDLLREPEAAAQRYPAAHVRASEETIWFAAVNGSLTES